MDDWKLEPAHDIGLSLRQRAADLRREAGLLETAAHLCWWGFVRAFLSLYHRLRVEHPERIPRDPPFVIVANHCSHLDALVLASPLPWRIRDRIFPIAAGDAFFETPAMAIFSAWMINALPMWRRSVGAHAIQTLRDRLTSEPCAYILFPEGARSRNGHLKPFKAGLGMLVASSNVPVIPCHVQGAFEALPPGHRFPRRRRITLRVGHALAFQNTPNDHAGWQQIAAQAEAAVRRLAAPQCPVA